MASRITDAVLFGAYNQTAAPVLDLKYGGQQGWSPRLGRIGADGKVFAEWISNQAYIKRNVIPVVLEAPLFFKYMPEPEKWISTYKAIMEVHPITIDGLQAGLTVETVEHAVGGAGEQQEEVSNVTRARSTISYAWNEKAGKPFAKFWDMYIRYGMMDPDTKSALVSTRFEQNFTSDLYTPDYYTGTILFIEPDITNRYVIEAWLCGNMFPKGNGEVTGKRDKQAGGELQEVSIEFASITMYNDSVKLLAKDILDKLMANVIDPSTRYAFAKEVSADLKEDTTPYGFKAQASNVN